MQDGGPQSYYAVSVIKMQDGGPQSYYAVSVIKDARWWA